MLRYLVIAALVSLSACSFVEQKPGSENVTVSNKDVVVGCQSKGKSRVTVLSEIGFADLMDEYVAEKLDMMGKNAAVDQGGDTIVKIEEPEPGIAVYGIYKCK
jgi:hypothetical protein